MTGRILYGTTRVLSFCSSIGFRRDDLLKLGEQALGPLRVAPAKRPPPPSTTVEVDGIPLRVDPAPFSDRMREETIWRCFDDPAQPLAFPVRLAVRLPLRFVDVPVGWPMPRSMAVEALVSAFGVAVKLRFTFDEASREALVEWPERDREVTLRSAGAQSWTGTLREVVGLAGRAALRALGPPWEAFATPERGLLLEQGVRRVFAEIAEDDGDANDDEDADIGEPSQRLLAGLARQQPGYGSMTAARLFARTYRISDDDSFIQRESQIFAPPGAALYLLYDPAQGNRSWRAANCRRRGVVYSLSVHNLLIDSIRSLVCESEEGAEGTETAGLRWHESVREVFRLRLRVLTCLQDNPNYSWVRHYSRLQLGGDRVDALPGEVKEALGPVLVSRLVKQLGMPRPVRTGADPDAGE